MPISELCLILRHLAHYNLALCSLVIAGGFTAKADELVSLDSVLQLAEEKSESLRAIRQSLESVESEIRSRDLELSPVLSHELSAVRDDLKATSSRNEDNEIQERSSQGRYGLTDITLTKPFASGAELSLTGGQIIRDPGNQERARNVTDWEVRLSQSLLRNGFGRSTQLRREGEVFELQSRRFAALLERQQYFQSVEEAFWDLVLAQKEVVIRQSNLERSKGLESWTRERLDRFAAEEADLLQVQALRSERQLDLAIADNVLEISRNRLRQLIPGIDPFPWRLDLQLLERSRDPLSLLVEGRGTLTPQDPLRLDVLATMYRARQYDFDAARVEDSLRPDLSAYFSFGANGFEDRLDQAWTAAGSSDSNVARVGLLFSVQLDTELKKDRVNAAKLNANAEKSRARAALTDSSVSWSEIQRAIRSFALQLKEARNLASLQQRKVETERERFEQGKSTTFQLTSFEVDAAESQLRLYRILTNLRKVESRARTFTNEEGLK